jgi:hypothetical protein
MGASDPFGNPVSPRPRNPIFPAFPIVAITLVCIGFVWLLARPDGRTQLRKIISALDPMAREAECRALSGDAQGGPEGTCVRFSPRFGGPTTFVVVNAHHLLRAPEYTVRTGALRFTGPGQGPAPEFGEGVEQLLSVHLSVTNTTGRELQFGEGSPGSTEARYTREPDIVQLVLPDAASRSGAPEPELLGAIPPGGTRSGWVTFGVPAEALRSLSEPGARLDFLRAGGKPGYTGQIRI